MSIFRIGHAPGALFIARGAPFSSVIEAPIRGGHVACPRRGSISVDECDDCVASDGRDADGSHQRCRFDSADSVAGWMRPLARAPTASPRELARQALVRAQTHEAHELLVLDDHGVLVGVVCQCDLRRAAHAATVGESMPPDLFVTDASTSIGEAWAAMDALAISCLPVVSGPLLVGIVGGGEFARAGVPGAGIARHRGCKRAPRRFTE